MTDEFTHSTENQIVCMGCGETILYLDDPRKRQVKLYPVRCSACVTEMIESGVAEREGYSPWEARYVV